MFSLQAAPIHIDAGRQAMLHEKAGAYAAFEGWIRNHNEGKPVERLEYEAFEALALAEGEKIINEACERFDIYQARCIHRTGALEIGECAVWVGAVAAHRDEAFKACRYIIDEVKHRLPIWKKEFYTDGASVWVNCQNCTTHHTPAFSESDFYARQMILPEVGPVGQDKLRHSSVLVIGAGGLGSPVLQYLAASGVGTIGICEFDRLHFSNLHRQVLYGSEEVGQPKAELAAKRLQALNPFIQVKTHDAVQTFSEAETLFEHYDWVLDCTDNFRARFLINDAAVLTETPLIQASVYQYEGQLQLVHPDFNTPCLRCQWSEMPEEDCVGSCAETGVLGVVPGVLGTLQAAECIKQILGLSSPLQENLLLFDLLTLQTRLIQRTKNLQCPFHGNALTRETPEDSSGMDQQKARPSAAWTAFSTESSLNDWEISGSALRKCGMEKYYLIDIREREEILLQPAPLPCFVLPLSEIDIDAYQPETNRDTLYICRSGRRTAGLVKLLREKGHSNVYSLAGGVLELTRQSDEAVALV